MSEPARPSVSILCLLWAGDARFEEHLSSLRDLATECVELGTEILFLANGREATDILRGDSWNLLRERTIAIDENLGVATGWNLLAARVTGRVLVFLNQDARTNARSLLRLADELEKSSACIAGPRGSFWDFNRMAHLAYPPKSYRGAVDIVSGFCFAVRREHWELMGGVDERLSPCSFEEVDLALRSNAAGLGGRLQVPGVVVQHEFGISAASSDTLILWRGDEVSLAEVTARNAATMQRVVAVLGAPYLPRRLRGFVLLCWALDRARSAVARSTARWR